MTALIYFDVPQDLKSVLNETLITNKTFRIPNNDVTCKTLMTNILYSGGVMFYHAYNFIPVFVSSGNPYDFIYDNLHYEHTYTSIIL